MGCALINENNFFEKVAKNLGDPNKAVEEIIENALRAKAKNIEIWQEGDKLVAQNDGEILENFSKLLRVADSGYDEDVIKRHKPAGMGVLIMLSFAKKVVFESGNKKLAVESEKFFRDKEYRESLFEKVEQSNDFIDGFKINLYAKEEKIKKILQKTYEDLDKMHRYDVRILINGKEVKKAYIKAKKSVKVDEGILKGCVVHLSSERDLLVKEYAYICGNVYWFGKYIRDGWSGVVIEVVEENDFIVPALPDRTRLAMDGYAREKVEKELISLFKKELKAKAMKMIEEQNDDVPFLTRAVKKGIIDEKELDVLEKWDKFQRNGDFIYVEQKYGMESVTVEWEGCGEDSSPYVWESSVIVEILGGAPKIAPSWVKEKEIHEEITVNVKFSKLNKAAYLGKNYDYGIIESKAGNKEIDFIFMEDGTIYLTKDFLYDSGTVANIVCDYWDDKNFDDVEWEVSNDLDAMRTAIEGKVDINSFKESIKKALLFKYGVGNVEIKHIEFKNGKIVVNEEYALETKY